MTPGVLRYGVAGLRCYEPAVVATQQWYVGPGQQPVVVDKGYDQGREDELFSTISWPSDGYRLFEISHFIGDRDWFDGMLESNCLFAPRSLLEQVGGFDDSFSMAGGGYANLDLWERLGSSPGVTIVTHPGRGFVPPGPRGHHHQRRCPRRSTEQDLRLRRALRGAAGQAAPGPDEADALRRHPRPRRARRTRSRRMTASSFAGQHAIDGPDGLPASPEPMPEELRSGVRSRSYWRGLAWQQTHWLGQPVAAAPTDLFVYQELLSEVRPDWIIETGTAGGGRARFLASICDLLGHGRVISVGDDRSPRRTPPHHLRRAGRAREQCGATGARAHRRRSTARW